MKGINALRMQFAFSILGVLFASFELEAVKVGIVGGGITGVYTSHKLSKKGYEVAVVNDGVPGGRIRSITYKEKNYDHGAVEIGSHYDWTLPLVKKYNLSTLDAPQVYDLNSGWSLVMKMTGKYGVWPTITALPTYSSATAKYCHQSYGYDDSLTDPSLSQGTSDFLDSLGVPAMAGPLSVVLPFYGYSHGYTETPYTTARLNEVPAAHTVKVFSSQLAWDVMKSSIPFAQYWMNRAGFTIVEGFYELFKGLYKDAASLGVEFFDDKIVSVRYNQSNKKVELTGGKTYQFDQVISTVMPGEMTGLEVEGLSDEQKTALSKMKYNYYGTTIFLLSKEAAKKIPARQYANFEYSGYEPTLLFNKFPNDPVWISYNYVQGLSEDDHIKSKDALKKTLWRVFGITSKDIEFLSQRYVKYYPHPEKPELMGSLTKAFNSMQGMYDGKLYFTGAMWDFDIVDGVIRHADQMTDKYFSGTKEELTN